MTAKVGKEVMTSRERIYACLRGEEVDRFPVWMKMNTTLKPEAIKLRVNGIQRFGLLIGEHLVILPYPYNQYKLQPGRKIYRNTKNPTPLGNTVLS